MPAPQGFVALGLASLLALVANRGPAAEPAQATSAPAAYRPRPKGEVTFNRHIAPILFKHCSTCHRPGEVAPFALLSYRDAQKRSGQLRSVTAEKFMPPWKSVAGHGRFQDERRLSPEELGLIAQWAEEGAPEGAAADLPAAPKFTDGWRLGPPDIVLTMPEAFEVPPDGPDIYRNFVLPVDVPAGKYVKAAEYRPGNRRVVHHAALALDMPGTARKLDASDPGPGFKGGLNIPGRLFPGSMAAWTPGRDPIPLPDGLSMPWPTGVDLILQLHLHPSGKAESERSQIGLYLTADPPSRSMIDLLLIDKRIDIPPGEKTYRTRDEVTLPADMLAYGLFPHMHMIGKELKVTAYPPAGEPFSLLWINDWDFNWQNFYQYAEPVKLGVGTRLVLECVHDNSAENSRNPSSPPRQVKWGEQSFDEMSAAILQLVPLDDADLTKFAGHRGRLVGGITAKPQRKPGEKPPEVSDESRAAIARYDQDKSGKLSFDEVKKAAEGVEADRIRKQFERYDADRDGELNAQELSEAIRALRGG